MLRHYGLQVKMKKNDDGKILRHEISRYFFYFAYLGAGHILYDVPLVGRNREIKWIEMEQDINQRFIALLFYVAVCIWLYSVND